MQISGQANIETFLPFFLFSLHLFILVIIIIIIFFLTGQRHGVLYHHWDLNYYFRLYCATAIPRGQDSQPFFFPFHSPRSSQFSHSTFIKKKKGIFYFIFKPLTLVNCFPLILNSSFLPFVYTDLFYIKESSHQLIKQY